jgi:hypothetical protein
VPSGVARAGGLLLAVLVAGTAAAGLCACGSASRDASASASAGSGTVEIAGVLPKDAGSEPPWNGRFVQVDASGSSLAAMAAGDWSVYVDGKKQALAKPPDVRPYAADTATVVFIFRDGFTDLRDYDFRVVYAPPGGPKVKRSWRYVWEL